jgi:hypothetical protein
MRMRNLVALGMLAALWGGGGELARGTAGDREPDRFYVAPFGDDAWSGRLADPAPERTDGPFATLEGAREAVRAARRSLGLPHGAEIVLRGGTHRRSQTFQLTAEDSGRPDAPLAVRSAPGEQARLMGGTPLEAWRLVDDPAALARLPEAARDHVVHIKLPLPSSEGADAAFSSPGESFELFYDGRPMTPARWPNSGFAKIAAALGSTPVDVRGVKGCVEGRLQLEPLAEARLARWQGESDPRAHGYWFWDWSDQRHRVQTIDPERRTIELAPPYHNYGYRQGQWFYVYNLLSELDQPGEWHFDPQTGEIYFWPPGELDGVETFVTAGETLIALEGASHVTLEGLVCEGTSGSAIAIAGGVDNRVAQCVVRRIGGWAITIEGGERHVVADSRLHCLGAGGVSASGGELRTLTPGGHLVCNNAIHDYARIRRMYQPGIQLRGVGLRAEHNLIYDAPHMGIGFGGNDHAIEYNELHHVCQESNDAGAIYAGRSWIMRGTTIRHNYLHHIQGFEDRGCVGVYLDDMYCGTQIVGNLFYKATRAAFIGGGRDCLVENNCFVDCRPALHVDARALGWAHDHSDEWIKEARDSGTLSGVRFGEPPYSERYPELLTLMDDDPAAPKGNRVVRNLVVGGVWDEVEDRARPLLALENNLLDAAPGFVGAASIAADEEVKSDDFALPEEAAALQAGFVPLPLTQMGLQREGPQPPPLE